MEIEEFKIPRDYRLDFERKGSESGRVYVEFGFVRK